MMPILIADKTFTPEGNTREWMAQVRRVLPPLRIITQADVDNAAWLRSINIKRGEGGDVTHYRLFKRRLQEGQVHVVHGTVQLYGEEGWVPACVVSVHMLPTIYYRYSSTRRTLAVHMIPTVATHYGIIH